ncbi:hypothetical protein Tco_1252952 [Tanacetum coccineum]
MDRKITLGACQILGGKLVYWSAKKQQSVAMSSTEAEYVAAAGCCLSIVWMKSQLSDYDIHYKMVPIFCDNTSAIAISNNPVINSRTKHIDIRYHFIRDHILKGDIELHFILIEYQLVDIFTKPLDEPTFTRLKAELDPMSHTEEKTDANKQENPKEPKHSTDANIEFIGSSTPQPSVTQAQPITIINPEPIVPQREGKGIATDEHAEDQRKQVKALSTVHPNPDALVLKLGIHPKDAITAKAGEKFKKAQDAKHDVLKKKHTKKVRKSLKLRKHKYDNYMWTISSRLKPEKNTDIKIHPKTKPVVITVYRGTDGRNFNVHNPFAFVDFGISKLDELREIIPRNKNTVVNDLINSLNRRYERIKKITKELGIPSALPAPIPEQASSKSSRRKRKHMELEPEIKIPGLECNQALLENVPFVNNMVIEEPEYVIFFTDEFSDQSFQRWSDINKVGIDALVSYLVSASMVHSPKNARFGMKLKKLIAEHYDQEKLKSKKVKLEALGYEID